MRIYREAGAASVAATVKISRVDAHISREHPGLLPPALPWAGPDLCKGHSPAHSTDIATMAGRQPDRGMPGPVERAVRQLGVVELPLLARAQTLDEAASKLLSEATDHTAAQRWNAAATASDAPAFPGRLIDLVLARDQESHTPASQMPEMRAMASKDLDVEAQA